MKYQDLLSDKELLIVELDKIKGSLDDENSKAAKDMLRQYLSGRQLTHKQWWYIRALVGRK